MTTPATATTDGQIVYTAAVTFNGQTYTSTQTVVIPATGSGGGGNTGNPGGSGSQGGGTTNSQPSQTGGNQTGDNSPIMLLILAGRSCRSGCVLWTEETGAESIIAMHYCMT